MKNAKILVLAIGLGFILLAGQPHAVVGAYNNSDLVASIAPNGYTASQDYSVEITRLGPSALENYTAVSDGLYHITSDNAVTIVRMSADVTGFNLYDDIMLMALDSYFDEDANATVSYIIADTFDDIAFAGELYLIVNGDAARASKAFLTGAGADVPLVSGMNTVSLLYVGRDQDGTVTWASDTINVRIFGSDEDTSAASTLVDVAYTSTVTDAATTADERIDITNLIYWNWGEHGKNKVFEPVLNVSASYTNGAGESSSVENSGNLLYAKSASGALDGTMTFSGVVDTSGFHGAYHFMNFNFTSSAYDAPALVPRTTGVTLVQDAKGLSLLGESGTVSLLDYTGDAAYSTVSLVALADYGTWDLNSDYYGYGVDWDAQFSVGMGPADSPLDMSTVDHDNNETTPEVPNNYNETYLAYWYGWNGGFFGTNDFEAEEFRVSVKPYKTDVGTQTVTEQVTEIPSDIANAPGFGVILALMSIGTLAYLTPKLRKE